ncbi:hypothetical protein PENTCL1PPCAC_13901, partial [Pristionchus entomophagus]
LSSSQTRTVVVRFSTATMPSVVDMLFGRIYDDEAQSIYIVLGVCVSLAVIATVGVVTDLLHLWFKMKKEELAVKQRPTAPPPRPSEVGMNPQQVQSAIRVSQRKSKSRSTKSAESIDYSTDGRETPKKPKM